MKKPKHLYPYRVFFQGVGKRDEFIYGGIVLNPTSKSLLEDRWNPERSVQENLAHAKLPRYVNGQQNNYEISDFYVKSAAYLRLKNLQLGYTLHAYFRGKKELFQGLAMERLEKEWNVYPVLHLDFSMTKYTALSDLLGQLNLNLYDWENSMERKK